MKLRLSICALFLLIGCADEPHHYMNNGGGVRDTCPKEAPLHAGDECLAAPFDTVTFSNGNSSLSPDGRITVARQAAWLKQYPGTPTIVKGYADDKGSDTENLNLAQLRAVTVKRRLVSDGISPTRITTIICLTPTQDKGACDAPSRVNGHSAYSVPVN
jgi:peptidoglycan-associated lipoprotein